MRRRIVLALAATSLWGWEFDHPYRFPDLPAVTTSTGDTVFAFSGVKTGDPKTYGRTSTQVRISGFGALARDPSDASGSTFWTLEDRGPCVPYQSGTLEARIFPVPSWHQRLVRFRIGSEGVEILSIDSLRSLESDTQYTVGVNSTKFASKETALRGRLDSAVVDPLAVIAPREAAYDFEALRVLDNGNLVASDELGPALVEIRRDSLRLEREWYPGRGLPPVFASRRENRGFEALATTPSGKLVAMLQSAADNPGKSDTKDSRAVRILRFDPQTGQSNEYVYLMDLKGGTRPGSEGRISDLEAISEWRFLALETGSDRSGKAWVDLVEFDLEGATDVHDDQSRSKGKTFSVGGAQKTPEEIGLDTSESVWIRAGIVVAARRLRRGDLLGQGVPLPSDKPEGMVLLGDSAVALLNDDDHGVQDKNSDGIWHAQSDAARITSLVYVRLPPSSGLRFQAAPGGMPSVRLSGGGLDLVCAACADGPVELLSVGGRLLARGALGGGRARMELASSPSGLVVLRMPGRAGFLPLVVVR